MSDRVGPSPNSADINRATLALQQAFETAQQPSPDGQDAATAFAEATTNLYQVAMAGADTPESAKQNAAALQVAHSVLDTYAPAAFGQDSQSFSLAANLQGKLKQVGAAEILSQVAPTATAGPAMGSEASQAEALMAQLRAAGDAAGNGQGNPADLMTELMQKQGVSPEQLESLMGQLSPGNMPPQALAGMPQAPDVDPREVDAVSDEIAQLEALGKKNGKVSNELFGRLYGHNDHVHQVAQARIVEANAGIKDAEKFIKDANKRIAEIKQEVGNSRSPEAAELRNERDNLKTQIQSANAHIRDSRKAIKELGKAADKALSTNAELQTMLDPYMGKNGKKPDIGMMGNFLGTMMQQHEAVVAGGKKKLSKADIEAIGEQNGFKKKEARAVYAAYLDDPAKYEAVRTAAKKMPFTQDFLQGLVNRKAQMEQAIAAAQHKASQATAPAANSDGNTEQSDPAADAAKTQEVMAKITALQADPEFKKLPMGEQAAQMSPLLAQLPTQGKSASAGMKLKGEKNEWGDFEVFDWQIDKAIPEEYQSARNAVRDQYGAKRKLRHKTHRVYNEIMNLLNSGLPIESLIMYVMILLVELQEEKFEYKVREVGAAEELKRLQEAGVPITFSDFGIQEKSTTILMQDMQAELQIYTQVMQALMSIMKQIQELVDVPIRNMK